MSTAPKLSARARALPASKSFVRVASSESTLTTAATQPSTSSVPT